VLYQTLISIKVEDAKQRAKNLEEAKKIVIEQDPKLPKPIKVTYGHSCIIILANHTTDKNKGCR